MSMWASIGDAGDNSHDGQNMALVGGISYGLEHGDRGVDLYNHLLFFNLRRIYYDSANLNLGSQLGSAYGLHCRPRRGIMYVNTPSLSWKLGRRLPDCFLTHILT